MNIKNCSQSIIVLEISWNTFCIMSEWEEKKLFSLLLGELHVRQSRHPKQAVVTQSKGFLSFLFGKINTPNTAT